MSPARRVGLGLAALTGLGAAVGAYAFAEARMYTLRRATARVLPPGSAPVSVLHLSDIHLLPGHHKKLDWIAGLADLKPDLVINTGDNISSADAVAPLFEALDELLDVPGAFVFGSNDYVAPTFKNPLGYLTRATLPGHEPASPVFGNLPWTALRDGFTARGWANLTHRRALLQVAGHTIELRGTDDGHLARDRYDVVAGPPTPQADLSIGVTHAPYLRLLDAMTADGVDLVMAGHTHGGQVCLPSRALITNCDLDVDRVKGLSQHTAGGHTSALHVSAGLGTSPFAPYRLFCRPEATLLRLVAR
ncbi:metallophosphoesterase [Propionibacteriaceae bacterium G1746]|uniref:metallophosphoesterase n=1 Tax=Aestuariimicrobium sp. G57 TaxID=3418485 RepID=UPI003C148349